EGGRARGRPRGALPAPHDRGDDGPGEPRPPRHAPLPRPRGERARRRRPVRARADVAGARRGPGAAGLLAAEARRDVRRARRRADRHGRGGRPQPLPRPARLRGPRAARLRSRRRARLDGRDVPCRRVRLVHAQGPARAAADGPLALERRAPLPALERAPHERARAGGGHVLLPPRPRRVRRPQPALGAGHPDLGGPRRAAVRRRLHRRRGRRAGGVRPRGRRAGARGRGRRHAHVPLRRGRHGATPPPLPAGGGVTEEWPDAFRTARPIWPEGRATEMNRFAGFRAVLPPVEAGPVMLRVAASSIYRVFVNGAFVGHGPARGPHGRFRVDEWTLGPWLRDGPNLVAIEAAGYNVNSYYLLDQPAFV